MNKEEEYVRVDSRYICPICFKEAWDHDLDKLTDENGDPLRRLCDGQLVKT